MLGFDSTSLEGDVIKGAWAQKGTLGRRLGAWALEKEKLGRLGARGVHLEVC